MLSHPATFAEFRKLSSRGNVIPVYIEVNADLDTPVSAFLKIRKGKYSFLLESVEGQEKIARYSFLGTEPSLIFRSNAERAEIISKLQGIKSAEFSSGSRGPVDELKKIMRGFCPVSVARLPRFCGGLVGYAGYDTVRFIEELPERELKDAGFPDCLFILAQDILIFDHFRHTIMIVSNVVLPAGRPGAGEKAQRGLYEQALRRISALKDRLNRKLSAQETELAGSSGKAALPKTAVSKKSFCRMVEKAKKYIRDGDIIQVVLSRRMEFQLSYPGFDVYRRLRSINPSPYMFFLEMGEIRLIGASPEILVRCEDGLVRTRPIAGTRPRGKDDEADLRNERELLADEKERAEHVMLVDLGRNDLGRICKEGSVTVNEFMKVERYSHVMHLVSEVTGTLKKGYDVYDVLASCFPAGTVSGSPKIRAMEIIEELEDTRRGPYAGCVGYFSFSGNMDTCITIRTVFVNGRNAYIQAGAGIVADSVPEKEYAETDNKARALLEAITQKR